MKVDMIKVMMMWLIEMKLYVNINYGDSDDIIKYYKNILHKQEPTDSENHDNNNDNCDNEITQSNSMPKSGENTASLI